MKQIIHTALAFIAFAFLTSCASSKSSSVVSYGNNLSNYQYVTFGEISKDGSPELSDLLMIVSNEIAVKRTVISDSEVQIKLRQGYKVISPQINVKTERFDGGHTYITITFRDYMTSETVAIVKSSGIGWSISQDQKMALKAIRKELDKVFK